MSNALLATRITWSKTSTKTVATFGSAKLANTAGLTKEITMSDTEKKISDSTIFVCGRKKAAVVETKFKCKCGVKYSAGDKHVCRPKCLCGGTAGRHFVGCGEYRPPDNFPGKERIYG